MLPAHLPPPSCTHAQSGNPVDCSPPGSSVHGIFQARILEWVAISFCNQASFNFMAAVTICSDLEPKKIVCPVPIVSPSVCHEVMGPDAMILVFLIFNFNPAFSLSLTFIKRLFNSLLSATRVVLSAYLRLLIFLPAILIPACASSSPGFRKMYSVYKLNK